MKKTGLFVISLLFLCVVGYIVREGVISAPKEVPQSQAPTTSPVKPARNVVAANFISSDVGWMSVDNQDAGTGNNSIIVYRTNDGGKAWTEQLDFKTGNVSPGVSAGWMHFFDSSNGLVLGSEGKSLYRTTDGGSHWITLNLPAPVMNPSMIAFSSPLNGWILEITGGAAGSESAAIYRTVDGGSRWETIATTSPLTGPDVPGQLSAGGTKSGIAFKDASTGWVTGRTAAIGHSWLFKSSDGGRHWQGQVISQPPDWAQAEIWTSPPYFINSKAGALPLFVNADFYLMFTQDGGQHWETPVKLPGTHDGETVPVWAFFNAYSIMTSVSNHLWTTQNGGQSWTDFVIPPDMTVAAMGFINSNIGWALASSKVSNSQDIVFLQTIDGGRHWVTIPAVAR